MSSPNLNAIDDALAELGEVPTAARVSSLVQRYVGQAVSLDNVDGLLAGLGHSPGPVRVMPLALPPTVVDLEAPKLEEPPHWAESAVAASQAPAQAIDELLPSLHPGAEPVVAEAPASLPVPVSVPVAAPVGVHFPWDSEPPSAAMSMGDEATSVKPVSDEATGVKAVTDEATTALTPAAADFEALFGDDDTGVRAPRILDMPGGAVSSRPPRGRHDTLEHLPAIAPRLAQASSLDLDSAEDATTSRVAVDDATTSQVVVEDATTSQVVVEDATTSQVALADDGDAQTGEIALGDGDEFEILVDDEILEIDEDAPERSDES